MQQAYASTIENQKRIMLLTQEKFCIQDKVDEYYIGGQANSPNWMCPGDKYRLNPNSAAAEWQIWYNGSWTSNFDWNAGHTCQNYVSPCNKQQCGGPDGRGGTCGCASGKMCISGQCQAVAM